MKLDSLTQDIIVNAKLGNEEALNKIFAKYQARILRIVRLRLPQGMREKLRLQSMDIVQEVFMYAFQHLKDFEPQSQGHFLNWLSKKVEHYICDRLDYVSRAKREATGGEISIDQAYRPNAETGQMRIQIKDDGTTPSQFAVIKEREGLIDSLLELLEPEQREFIIHRNLEEMTFAEMGALFGKSEDAVRKQYTRAFKKLIDLSEEKLKPIIAEETYKRLTNEF
ncbi:MAG: sigma-70 family RNA polymerase sigma factor [Omnitrophica bacterium]|nr:sigma-70 family RNA polymerase sigma factor [Candidatus Omnitrophota bacterium]